MPRKNKKMNDFDINDGMWVPESKKFFRKMDWAAFWTSAIISFIVYFITAAPTVTLEDSGELAVAGDYLGVPHPPGYPLWTMCAWVFTKLLGFVSYLGQPNPAWAITIMSGFFGALAAGFTAMLVCRTSSDLVQQRMALPVGAGIDEPGYDRSGANSLFTNGALGQFLNATCWVCGVAASLVFAFSPVMWSQATIVEVYTLNAFFLMLIYLLTYIWMNRPSDKILWITGFVFGLGSTNYQVLFFALLPLAMAIMLHNIKLFRDFVLIAVPFGVTIGMMKLGSLPSQPGFLKHPVLKTNDLTSAAVVDTKYYLWAVILTLVFACGAVIIGFLNKRKPEKVSEVDENKNTEKKLIVAGVMVLAALGMIIVCSVLPAPPIPLELAHVPRSEYFSWKWPLLIFFGAMALLWLFSVKVEGGIWYSTAVTGILLIMGIFIMRGALLGLTHPLSGAFAFYLVMNFVFLALAWLLLPYGRTVSLTVFAVELGLAFYGYMPLASETNPPMNWGYPRTWEGFKHAITRGQYEQIAPLSPESLFSAEFVKKVGAYFQDLRMQFTLLLVPFGFVPFSVWEIKIGKYRFRALSVAIAMAVAVAVIVALDKLFVGLNFENMRIDKVLLGLLLVMSFIGVQGIVFNQIMRQTKAAFGADGKDLSARIVSGVSAAVLVVVVIIATLGFSNAAAEMMLDAAGANPEGEWFARFNWLLTAAVFLVWGVLACGQVFLMFGHKEEDKFSFKLEIGQLTQRWHIATIVGFIMMSLLLIALAKPKYDVQDNFIQKVKFISSHAIFAVWVGYGLMYALVESLRYGKLSRVALVAVLFTPLIPIHENYFNDEMVDVISCADQLGHDFGWQFGNYQLRGAEAITEELDDDEEPLPNPSFPPAMSQNAVFFGGTDPGRFVPTYMIYSAQVRPDVFLITQNALADVTYLDTMRNLYADQIWMPTEVDNSVAFRIYVTDVREGRRPNIGGIEERPGGGVQVTGAAAVMEINGIITEMIFKKNRDRHDFYVEESYPIQWMYPYLSPHGLIMKLNYDPVEYDKKKIAADMDFWDWYVRRLIADPNFARDLPARKSFSKLRNAISGTYAQRGMLREAERGFHEAIALYVYSPESTMNMIQRIYLPQRRLDESLDLLLKLKTLDPNNASLPIEQVSRLQTAHKMSGELMKKLSGGEKLNEADTLALLDSLITVDYRQQALQVLETYKSGNKPSPNFRAKAGFILSEARMYREAAAEFSALSGADLKNLELISNKQLYEIYRTMTIAQDVRGVERVLVVYLNREENIKNWEAWLDYAGVCLTKGDVVRARASLDFALKYGKRDAEILISQVPYLKQLYEGTSSQPLGKGFGPLRDDKPQGGSRK